MKQGMWLRKIGLVIVWMVSMMMFVHVYVCGSKESHRVSCIYMYRWDVDSGGVYYLWMDL